jgi:hypothetical protein
MPAKQSVEVKLGDKFRDLIREPDEFEKYLQKLEAELGLPTFYRSKPIAERMAAIGVDQAAIDHISRWLDAIKKTAVDRADELPDHTQSELAAQADGELKSAELWLRLSHTVMVSAL